MQAPLVVLGAVLIVWAVYRFAVAAPASLWRPEWLQDTVEACFPSDRGRHAANWLLAHRLPAPSAFLAALGLCAQEAPGRSTSYLLGQLTQDGFPAFFLIALAVKLPLPLGALATGLRRDPARTRDARAALPRAGARARDRRLPGDGHPVAHQHRRAPRAAGVPADRDARRARRRHALAGGPRRVAARAAAVAALAGRSRSRSPPRPTISRGSTRSPAASPSTS